jgi:hypothetical protein
MASAGRGQRGQRGSAIGARVRSRLPRAEGEEVRQVSQVSQAATATFEVAVPHIRAEQNCVMGLNVVQPPDASGA